MERLREINTSENRRRVLISASMMTTIGLTVIFLNKLVEYISAVKKNALQYEKYPNTTIKSQYEIEKWQKITDVSKMRNNYLYSYNTNSISDVSKILTTRGLVRNSHEDVTIQKRRFQKPSKLFVSELRKEDLLIDTPLTWINVTTSSNVEYNNLTDGRVNWYPRIIELKNFIQTEIGNTPSDIDTSDIATSLGTIDKLYTEIFGGQSPLLIGASFSPAGSIDNRQLIKIRKDIWDEYVKIVSMSVNLARQKGYNFSSRYYIPDFTFYIPAFPDDTPYKEVIDPNGTNNICIPFTNGTYFQLYNNSLHNILPSSIANIQKRNCDISIKWKNVDINRPTVGNEITNNIKLSEALESNKLEFSKSEWDDFNITVGANDFILVNTNYFQVDATIKMNCEDMLNIYTCEEIRDIGCECGNPESMTLNDKKYCSETFEIIFERISGDITAGAPVLLDNQIAEYLNNHATFISPGEIKVAKSNWGVFDPSDPSGRSSNSQCVDNVGTLEKRDDVMPYNGMVYYATDENKYYRFSTNNIGTWMVEAEVHTRNALIGNMNVQSFKNSYVSIKTDDNYYYYRLVKNIQSYSVVGIPGTGSNLYTIYPSIADEPARTEFEMRHVVGWEPYDGNSNDIKNAFFYIKASNNAWFKASRNTPELILPKITRKHPFFYEVYGVSLNENDYVFENTIFKLDDNWYRVMSLEYNHNPTEKHKNDMKKSVNCIDYFSNIFQNKNRLSNNSGDVVEIFSNDLPRRVLTENMFVTCSKNGNMNGNKFTKTIFPLPKFCLRNLGKVLERHHPGITFNFNTLPRFDTLSKYMDFGAIRNTDYFIIGDDNIHYLSERDDIIGSLLEITNMNPSEASGYTKLDVSSDEITVVDPFKWVRLELDKPIESTSSLHTFMNNHKYTVSDIYKDIIKKKIINPNDPNNETVSIYNARVEPAWAIGKWTNGTQELVVSDTSLKMGSTFTQSLTLNLWNESSRTFDFDTGGRFVYSPDWHTITYITADSHSVAFDDTTITVPASFSKTIHPIVGNIVIDITNDITTSIVNSDNEFDLCVPGSNFDVLKWTESTIMPSQGKDASNSDLTTAITDWSKVNSTVDGFEFRMTTNELVDYNTLSTIIGHHHKAGDYYEVDSMFYTPILYTYILFPLTMQLDDRSKLMTPLKNILDKIADISDSGTKVRLTNLTGPYHYEKSKLKNSYLSHIEELYDSYDSGLYDFLERHCKFNSYIETNTNKKFVVSESSFNIYQPVTSTTLFTEQDNVYVNDIPNQVWQRTSSLNLNDIKEIDHSYVCKNVDRYPNIMRAWNILQSETERYEPSSDATGSGRPSDMSHYVHKFAYEKNKYIPKPATNIMTYIKVNRIVRRKEINEPVFVNLQELPDILIDALVYRQPPSLTSNEVEYLDSLLDSLTPNGNNQFFLNELPKAIEKTGFQSAGYSLIPMECSIMGNTDNKIVFKEIFGSESYLENVNDFSKFVTQPNINIHDNDIFINFPSFHNSNYIKIGSKRFSAVVQNPYEYEALSFFDFEAFVDEIEKIKIETQKTNIIFKMNKNGHKYINENTYWVASNVSLFQRHELLSINSTKRKVSDVIVEKLHNQTKNLVFIDYEASYKSILPSNSEIPITYTILFEAIPIIGALASFGVDNSMSRLLLDNISKVNLGVVMIYTARVVQYDDLVWRNILWTLLFSIIVSYITMFIIKSILPKKNSFTGITSNAVIFSLVVSLIVYINSEVKVISQEAYGQLWTKHLEKPTDGDEKTNALQDTRLYDRMLKGETRFSFSKIKSLNLKENDWVTLRKNNSEIIYLVAHKNDIGDHHFSKFLERMIKAYGITMGITLVTYFTILVGAERGVFVRKTRKKL